MSNRMFLHSLADVNVNLNKLRADPSKYPVVAECSYGVPMTWLGCFRPSDVKTFVHKQKNWDDPSVTDTFHIPVPIIRRTKAIENLEASLPFIQALTGEKVCSTQYLEQAVANLHELERPYIAIDLNELMMTVEQEELVEHLNTVLGQGKDAIRAFKACFGSYAAKVKPYSLHEFFEMDTYRPGDKRHMNTLALYDGWYS